MDIGMNMEVYMESIKPLKVTKEIRKKSTDNVTIEEYGAYRSLNYSNIWTGNG